MPGENGGVDVSNIHATILGGKGQDGTNSSGFYYLHAVY